MLMPKQEHPRKPCYNMPLQLEIPGFLTRYSNITPQEKSPRSTAWQPPNFLCEEKEEMPEWTLLPDTTTLLSYSCQKAICHFKGRNYTVWYTLEIPVSEGPWKLFGLPGLIIKAEDDKKHYTFNCTG